MTTTGRDTAHFSRSGMVLIMVLVLAALISGLVMNMIYLSRLRLSARSAVLRAGLLQAALTDAALQALQLLADDPDLQVDHPDEDWAQPQELTTPAGINIWLQITDLNRFYDINNSYIEGQTRDQTLPAAVLGELLTTYGDYTPTDRITALTDWMDPDDDGYRETAFYQDNGLTTRCANTWLESMTELTYVDGFSREQLEQTIDNPFLARESSLLEAITVIPGIHRQPVQVNANTASPAVLRSIAGIGRDQWVDYLLAMRESGPLTSLTPLANLVDEQTAQLANQFLSVKSSAFLLTIKAFLESSSKELHVLAIRDSRDGNVKIVRWIF